MTFWCLQFSKKKTMQKLESEFVLDSPLGEKNQSCDENETIDGFLLPIR